LRNRTEGSERSQLSNAGVTATIPTQAAAQRLAENYVNLAFQHADEGRTEMANHALNLANEHYQRLEDAQLAEAIQNREHFNNNGNSSSSSATRTTSTTRSALPNISTNTEKRSDAEKKS
jgi:hypothetical protein